MSKYKFKYRLSQKSSLTTIANAVRALEMEMKVEENGVLFSWWEWVGLDTTTPREIWKSSRMTDERVHEWLNQKLENYGLLAPIDPEP